MPDKKLPAVPETILKRRKRQAENRAVRAKAAIAEKQSRRKKRVDIFKRAEKYVKEYANKERDEIRLAREAKKEGNYYVQSEPKFAFVIRIRGINQVAPKVKKCLQLFRLRQINNGVFVKLNQATINMLRIIGKLHNPCINIHLSIFQTFIDEKIPRNPPPYRPPFYCLLFSFDIAQRL